MIRAKTVAKIKQGKTQPVDCMPKEVRNDNQNTNGRTGQCKPNE